MAEIKILPSEKIRWLERMALDLRLTATQFRVAVALGTHFNRGRRDTFVGREHLAAELGISVRAVEMAIGKLEELGYIERERVGGIDRGIGGRGNTNTYRMPLQTLGPAARSDPGDRDAPVGGTAPGGKTANEASPFPAAMEGETANGGASFSGEERANVGSQKGESFDAKGRTQVRPNPSIEPFSKRTLVPVDSAARHSWFGRVDRHLPNSVKQFLTERAEPQQARQQEEKRPVPRFRDDLTFAKLAGLLCPEDCATGWLIINQLDERDRRAQSGHLVELLRLTRTGRISESDLGAARLLCRRVDVGENLHHKNEDALRA